MPTPIQSQVAQQLSNQAIKLNKIAHTPGIDPTAQTEALQASAALSQRAATLLGLQLKADTQNMKDAVTDINNAQTQLSKALKNITNLNNIITAIANYLKAVDTLITIAKLAAAA